jgi:DNA-binding MarR family transcriptional regulator
MTDESLSEEDRAFLATNLKGLLQDVMEQMEARNTDLRENTIFADATPAEARLFAVLRGRERSISDLARVLGVTRQAVHHTVHRLIDAGVVELVVAEHSRREKLVRITATGRKVQAIAAANLRRIEAEMAAVLGEDKVSELRKLLLEFRDNAFPEDR